MSRDDQKTGMERRNFLKVMGTVTAGAAAAPLVIGEAEAKESREERRRARYQETEHVKRFYALNRL